MHCCYIYTLSHLRLVLRVDVVAVTEQTSPGQLRLSFVEVGPDQALWEYAALVTSLEHEILTVGQLYRDRADCEDTFDELKNQRGWGGFTTHDLQPLPAARPVHGPHHDHTPEFERWWNRFPRG